MNENTTLNKNSNNKMNMNNVKSFFAFVYEEYIKFPAYILVHPFKGFDTFKRDKKGKMSVSIVFVVVLILLQVLEFQFTGFVVNQRNVNDLNTIEEMSYVIVPIILIVISNWSVTTLLDGKGKMKEIFMMICYALYPLIWSKIFGLFFSNMIVEAEVGFYSLLMGLGVFLMVYMIFFGLISIHEYGVFKNILSLIGTFLAVMILLFILLLGYDLFQKIYGFIFTIYREISLRYL